MPLNTKVNKWAPKLTIIFQLTIWSIVGFIFVQKGAVFLCERAKTRNDTVNRQDKFTKKNNDELLRESNVTKSHFTIMKLIKIGRINVNPDYNDTMSNESSSRESHRTSNISSGIVEMIHHEHSVRDVQPVRTQTIYTDNKGEVQTNNNSISNGSLEFESDDFTDLMIKEGNFSDLENKDTEENKSKTKLKRSPMNRVGAVIAIIMLAIGVIMLLLGPLIIIIRALNSRRRTKILLQSKCYKDQPPTYEEATLMDQAPRYSTLQLTSAESPIII